MKKAETCDHDNMEQLTDEVAWCPDCGTRWAQNREQIARVHDLFMEKLRKLHPDHPWLELNFQK